jgi:hypothetical protein
MENNIIKVLLTVIPVVEGGIWTCQMLFDSIEQLVRHDRPFELVIQAGCPKRKSNHPWDVYFNSRPIRYCWLPKVAIFFPLS